MNLISKIEKLTPATDKLKHFFWGAIIAFLLDMSIGFLVNLFNINQWLKSSIILFIGVVIGWGIEFYQKKTKTGVYDNWDALYTALPFLLIVLSDIKF